MNHLSYRIAEKELWILADRAIFWPDKQSLFIADIHLGKAKTFRRYGIPLPDDPMKKDLDRLSNLIQLYSAKKLIILGDLFHAPSGQDEKLMDLIREWRKNNQKLEIQLIRGNHDSKCLEVQSIWNMECLKEPIIWEDFALCHYPQVIPGKYTLCGHIHPALKIRLESADNIKKPNERMRPRINRAVKTVNLSCFWMQKSTGVLPAYGTLTGSKLIQPSQEDNIFLTSEGEVIHWQKSNL